VAPAVRPIIDAGPGLNFLSINKERLLIAMLGRLSAPETVQDELLRKCRQDARFQRAEGVWRKLTPNWVEILSDAQTPALNAVVHRLTSLPMRDRVRQRKDLGETMVIAHAVVAAEAGADVTVLIDDGRGAADARSEAARLRRRRAAGALVGTMVLANTHTVLEKAAATEHLPDRAAMRTTYERLRGLDDGLPPIESTRLLSADVWG
jgi:hypothetical protein